MVSVGWDIKAVEMLKILIPQVDSVHLSRPSGSIKTMESSSTHARLIYLRTRPVSEACNTGDMIA